MGFGCDYPNFLQNRNFVNFLFAANKLDKYIDLKNQNNRKLTIVKYSNIKYPLSISIDCRRSLTTTIDDDKSKDFESFRAKEEEKYGQNTFSDQQQKQQQQNNQNPEDRKIEEIRERILDAALLYVNKNGWSRETITNGAESIGYPGVIHGMFPNSSMELIQHFYKKCNRELIKKIENEFMADKENPILFVNKCIKYRLQQIEPFITKWPQAIAIMSLPPNAPTALAQLLQLVDDICFYAGDKSVDFGWYVRRIGLASIYKMTELYMLQDSSVNYENTWTFLDRLIQDGKSLQAAYSFTDQTTRDIVHIANSTFKTVRNILGINVNR